MPGIVNCPEYLNSQYVFKYLRFKYLNTKMPWVLKYSISLNSHNQKLLFVQGHNTDNCYLNPNPFYYRDLFPSLMHSFPPRQSYQNPSMAWTSCYPLDFPPDDAITRLGLILKEPEKVIIYQSHRFNWAN